ncbi:MAG TPA: hypothetical protein VF952_01035 [Chloroflexia bacterium]|jgi:hypothetical protein
MDSIWPLILGAVLTAAGGWLNNWFTSKREREQWERQQQAEREKWQRERDAETEKWQRERDAEHQKSLVAQQELERQRVEDIYNQVIYFLTIGEPPEPNLNIAARGADIDLIRREYLKALAEYKADRLKWLNLLAANHPWRDSPMHADFVAAIRDSNTVELETVIALANEDPRLRR